MKKAMEKNDKNPKIRASVLWTEGKYAVVKAVFPEGMIRSLTARDLNTARRRESNTVMSRPETSEPAYAKVPLAYVEALNNELGEVAP